MAQIALKDMVDQLPRLSPSELYLLRSHVDTLVKFIERNELSTDLGAEFGARRGEEGSGLADAARGLLEAGVEEGRWTLADQALLAAVILSDSYQQQTFSSRDLNDVIEECGQPRVVNITSALSRLLERGYLEGSTKELRLSREGKAKARGLVAMLSREGEAA